MNMVNMTVYKQYLTFSIVFVFIPLGINLIDHSTPISALGVLFVVTLLNLYAVYRLEDKFDKKIDELKEKFEEELDEKLETKLGIRRDGQSWLTGYEAGLEGRAGPPPAGIDRLAWASGFIEGRAERTRRRVEARAVRRKLRDWGPAP